MPAVGLALSAFCTIIRRRLTSGDDGTEPEAERLPNRAIPRLSFRNPSTCRISFRTSKQSCKEGAKVIRKANSFISLYAGVAVLLLAHVVQAQQPAAKPAFTFEEVMVPMRDGVHLQTVILTPTDQQGPLPILFRRTPYGVPSAAGPAVPANFKELAQDGYIFVVQNLRGRFKSEGVFSCLAGGSGRSDRDATRRPTPTTPSTGS